MGSVSNLYRAACMPGSTETPTHRCTARGQRWTAEVRRSASSGLDRNSSFSPYLFLILFFAGLLFRRGLLLGGALLAIIVVVAVARRLVPEEARCHGALGGAELDTYLRGYVTYLDLLTTHTAARQLRPPSKYMYMYTREYSRVDGVHCEHNSVGACERASLLSPRPSGGKVRCAVRVQYSCTGRLLRTPPCTRTCVASHLSRACVAPGPARMVRNG